ncbi:hypothetical protein SAMN04488057_11140 [Cyclobacterium lianum]|uniref:Transcription elongation factor, GreA/GreB, C-term n=1 Tax=Cyclobacterium lianum TaxID=388280 RepID=A0A1M7PVY0_9BACT|nr:hypothetical protein [Cyclobacterium lianum]SHN21755.1 hypothetical protein SAMN04488057_11140 [Cyclobacterium lianum]
MQTQGDQEEDGVLPDAISYKRRLQELAGRLNRERIEDLNEQITALREASQLETKSSAGDKYETGRERINQRLDMLVQQSALCKEGDHFLKKIKIVSQDRVEEGALLQLSFGWIWIAISLGKISIDGREIQLVSVRSPLVQSLILQKKGHRVDFRGKQVEIMGIW